MKQMVIVLMAALALSVTPALPVLAQDAAPNCHTTQTASAVCEGEQAVIRWTAGNYQGATLALSVQAVGQQQDRTLLDGQVKNGTFNSGLNKLPSSTVAFIWTIAEHPSGYWMETVNYPAVSCVPTAARVSMLGAWRLW